MRVETDAVLVVFWRWEEMVISYHTCLLSLVVTFDWEHSHT